MNSNPWTCQSMQRRWKPWKSWPLKLFQNLSFHLTIQMWKMLCQEIMAAISPLAGVETRSKYRRLLASTTFLALYIYFWNWTCEWHMLLTFFLGWASNAAGKAKAKVAEKLFLPLRNTQLLILWKLIYPLKTNLWWRPSSNENIWLS